MGAGFMKPRKVKMLLLGPDAAGKTTLLYRLKTGRNIKTIPTIGYNVEEIRLKNGRIMLWDVGGQDKIRNMWKHYFDDVGAVVFAIDSSDRERLPEAKELLHSILKNREMKYRTVLVLANKQDVDGSMAKAEVAAGLGLNERLRHKWRVQPCCALTGDGLYEGLEWALREANQRQKSDDVMAAWVSKSIEESSYSK